MGRCHLAFSQGQGLDGETVWDYVRIVFVNRHSGHTVGVEYSVYGVRGGSAFESMLISGLHIS